MFDYPTGLKLFAQQAFYVVTKAAATPAAILAFAKKHEAEQYATQHAGRLVTLAEAKQGAAF